MIGLTDQWIERQGVGSIAHDYTMTTGRRTRHVVVDTPEHGKVVLHVAWFGDEPEWLKGVLGRARELLALPRGWDSYGARPLEPSRVIEALNLLGSQMGEAMTAPEIVPTNDGGVQLEWHFPNADIEVRAMGRGRFVLTMEDRRSGVEEEHEFSSDPSRLWRCLFDLAGAHV